MNSVWTCSAQTLLILNVIFMTSCSYFYGIFKHDKREERYCIDFVHVKSFLSIFVMVVVYLHFNILMDFFVMLKSMHEPEVMNQIPLAFDKMFLRKGSVIFKSLTKWCQECLSTVIVILICVNAIFLFILPPIPCLLLLWGAVET